jgi:hypothetical protein
VSEKFTVELREALVLPAKFAQMAMPISRISELTGIEFDQVLIDADQFVQS